MWTVGDVISLTRKQLQNPALCAKFDSLDVQAVHAGQIKGCLCLLLKQFIILVLKSEYYIVRMNCHTSRLEHWNSKWTKQYSHFLFCAKFDLVTGTDSTLQMFFYWCEIEIRTLFIRLNFVVPREPILVKWIRCLSLPGFRIFRTPVKLVSDKNFCRPVQQHTRPIGTSCGSIPFQNLGSQLLISPPSCLPHEGL